MSAAQEVKEPTLWISWDTCDIIQGQADFLREEDPELSESDAWERAAGDHDLFTMEWDQLLEDLQEKMDEYNPDGKDWFIRGENLGWQNRSGTMRVGENKAQAFLWKFLPDTDKTFKIWIDDEKRAFSITCWHHDSPMGEQYYIEIAKEEENG